MAIKKKPIEAVRGLYSAIPHSVLDSVALRGASHTARSLLLELMRQHNGQNNGQLHLAEGWLKRRGWSSSSEVIQRAKLELMERNLIIKTRQGGLYIGPDRFAVTWLHISDFTGLEISRRTYHPGAWAALNHASENRNEHTGKRGGVAPGNGVAACTTTPGDGAKSPDP